MGVTDLDSQIDQLLRCETIKEAEVKDLCSKAREILIEESNVQRVEAPVTVNTCLTKDLWRYPRAILRSKGAVQGRRKMSRH